MASRNYAKIAPEFWTGETGVAMRALGPVVGYLALYLISNPHAKATGFYRLPLVYAAADTGLEAKQIESALDKLRGVGFVETDDARELVWVREMGRYQIAEALKAGDKRRKWIEKALDPHRGSPLFPRFVDRYGEPWGLAAGPSIGASQGAAQAPTDAPSDAPSVGVAKPPRSQEQEQEHEQEKGDVGKTPTPVQASGVSATGLRPVAPTAEVEGGAPEKPHAPPREPEPEQGPEAAPAVTGAAERRLARYAGNAAKGRPEQGKAITWQKTPDGGVRGACLFGSDRELAPGPWQMPREVFEAIEPVLEAKVPVYVRPAPPMLPPVPDGTDPCHEPDDALVKVMLRAWSAVHVDKTGRRYNGNAGKRGETIAEAARMLRAESISPWVYFAFAWDSEKEFSRQAPKFFTLATPKAVGRYLDRVRSEAHDLRGMVVNGDKRQALLHLRQQATIALHRERPSTADEATALVESVLPRATYRELRSAVLAENQAAAKRDEIALDRGHWIW